MYMTNFCPVFMMIEMLNPLPKHFIFVKLRLDKIEHTALKNEWTHNIDTDADL